MSRPLVAIALFLIIVPAAHAVCPLRLRFTDNPPTLVWDNVPGAKGYQVQESFDDPATTIAFTNSRNYFVLEGPFVIRRRVSSNTPAFYTVTAIMPSNVLSFGILSEACTESIAVTIKADLEFRKLTRKGVVPIVGSGPGANGGRFKTSIKLIGSSPSQKGRLVFHPAGSVARDDDPSLAYSIDAVGTELEFDDIVAAMGRTGIGSLDIIPDEGSASVIPTVEARLYNDTPAGTFGLTTPALLPYDFLHPPKLTLKVPPPDARFRVNAGVRTLTETRVTALVYGISGRIKDFYDLTWPADYTLFGSIGQLIGIDLQPGESMTLFFEGAVIPFYTRTENRTNDPELFIAPHTSQNNVGSFVD